MEKEFEFANTTLPEFTVEAEKPKEKRSYTPFILGSLALYLIINN